MLQQRTQPASTVRPTIMMLKAAGIKQQSGIA
jgi:hypothetical protein